MSESSARLGLPYIMSGQAQKDVTHNEALTLIDAGLSACAEAVGLNSAPSAPTVGQCWIVGSAPTGVWAGQADALAIWTAGGWRFLPAAEGLRVWLKDQALWATHVSSEWVVGEEAVSRLMIGGVQVVGQREPSVSLPTGGATVDSEARSAIAAILSRLESHGLIAVEV